MGSLMCIGVCICCDWFGWLELGLMWLVGVVDVVGWLGWVGWVWLVGLVGLVWLVCVWWVGVAGVGSAGGVPSAIVRVMSVVPARYCAAESTNSKLLVSMERLVSSVTR